MTEPNGGTSSGGPLSRWLARYDEALERGERPPELRPEEMGVDEADLERFRSFLHMLNRTLRPPDTSAPASTIADRSDDPAASEEAALPQAIGRFQIERKLGRGGFGIVFRAFDPDMGRWVALKIPRAEALVAPGVRRRFLGEAHVAAQLDHPNLVPVFEAGEAGAICYIASAYCEGPTLRRWMKAGNAPVEPRRAARLVLAMTRAVEHMHARGLLHCDLKPENVLLDLPRDDEPDADPTPRITDFGLARLIDSPIGESTAAKAWGTPPYMAPEQIEQRREVVGPATDVYALGAILYELATGRPPHRAESPWELMRAVVADPPASPRSVNRSVPRDLGAIAMTCLEKRSRLRYPDAATLADDLECFLERRPTRARPLGPPRRLARWSARNPAATALIAMTLATLGVSVSYSIALRRTVAERDQKVVDLNRANVDLQQAKAETETALTRALEASNREQRQSYAATLTRAQREMDQGRSIQAQRRLRELIPAADSADPDPRDFAWHYLWRQSRRDRTVLDDLYPGSTCRISTGKGVLLGTSSGRGGGVWRIAWPSQSDILAPAAIRPSLRFERPGELGSGLHRAVVSTDGRLAAAWLVGLEALTVVDLESGKVQVTLQGGKTRSDAINLAFDRGLMAFGVPLRTPFRMGRQELDLDGLKILAYGVPGSSALAFTSDSSQIASARSWGTTPSQHILELWNIRTRYRILARKTEPISPAIAASPEKGGPIATGTLNGVVQLREPARGNVIATLPAPEGDDHRVDSLAFSADGKLLAAGYNRRAILWNVAERRRIESIEGLGDWVSSIAFLPERPGDVALGIGTGEVVIWHTEPIEDAVIPGGHDEEVWGVAFTADGDVATVGGDKRLKLWDGRTGAERRSLGGHEGWPSCLASAPAGGLLASADFDGRLLIWDAKEGRPLHNLQAHEVRIRAVAFSPDGRLIATGGRDATIRLWDAASGNLVATLLGHEHSIRGLAFGPDGRTLASAGEDPAVLLWDVESRRILKRWEPTSHPTCLAISPDGLTIVAGDARGAVMSWDIESGALRTSLPAIQAAEISGLAFSPDGRVLAAGGQSGIVSLVDVGMGQVHVTLAGHQKGVNAVAFSPDGRTLASVSHDRTLRLWWAGPPETSGSE